MCCTHPLRSTAYNASSRSSSLNAGDYHRKGMPQVIEKGIYKVGEGTLDASKMEVGEDLI